MEQVRSIDDLVLTDSQDDSNNSGFLRTIQEKGHWQPYTGDISQIRDSTVNASMELPVELSELADKSAKLLLEIHKHNPTELYLLRKRSARLRKLMNETEEKPAKPRFDGKAYINGDWCIEYNQRITTTSPGRKYLLENIDLYLRDAYSKRIKIEIVTHLDGSNKPTLVSITSGNASARLKAQDPNKHLSVFEQINYTSGDTQEQYGKLYNAIKQLMSPALSQQSQKSSPSAHQ